MLVPELLKKIHNFAVEIIDDLDWRGTLTDSENSISSVHSSQLQFWGFRKSAGSPRVFYLKAPECRQVLGKLIAYFDNEQLRYTLGPNCRIEAEKLQSELAVLVRIRAAGKSIKSGKFNTKRFAEFSSALQTHVKRKLKEHQLRAAYHLYLTQNGANFSVPGSGKTSVVLAVYEKLRKEGKVNGLGFDPFVEVGLAFHNQKAARHRRVAVAAKLRAVDLVAAHFRGRAPNPSTLPEFRACEASEKW